jgi:predicted O-methyltransferase YrrM
LQNSTGNFNLIFNDIDKRAYVTALPVIASKLHPGGVLIVDNVLWYGRVLNKNDSSESTATIRDMTRLLTEDPGWITTLAPIRDGLIVAYKTKHPGIGY